jgi:MoxR-like ATPase
MKTEILELQAQLAQAGYIADRSLATALTLLLRLGRPLLLEGDAGVGKTELAKALATAFDCALIRLQCYEGLDSSSAVYEWNYQHQLLTIKLQERLGRPVEEQEAQIFSERFLLPRPLLKAITQDQSPVLLIDEVDRADEEFEAYLLEVLSDFQISIPELGTIEATSTPYVVLTSNGTRELSDALRRRCLYHYLDYPNPEKELRIIERRLPGIGEALARQVVAFVHGLRTMDLRKKPGIAETLDWAASLLSLKITSLKEDPELMADTLTALLKTREDLTTVDLETIGNFTQGL